MTEHVQNYITEHVWSPSIEPLKITTDLPDKFFLCISIAQIPPTIIIDGRFKPNIN